MTSKSKLIRSATDKSGEDVGCEGPRGQVMAADDEDDLQWLDDTQYPISDEECGGVRISGSGNGF